MEKCQKGRWRRDFCDLLVADYMGNVVEAQVRVRPYYRKDGTYVRPHYRSRRKSLPLNADLFDSFFTKMIINR